MVTKTITVEYSGSVEIPGDLQDDAMRVRFERGADGARTGNVIVTTFFVVGHDVEQVDLTVPAAQLAQAKYMDALNAARASLAAKLGL